MKKCIIVKILFVWTFVCPGISLSQEPQEAVHYVNFLTPQTYDLIKYGSHPVSHFTGETNVTVPIYTYSDQDFSLPIYLGYNSSGFIPGKNEGMVGLNWYLNTGAGVVTRRVNGWPDEREGQPDYNPSELHGLFYGIQNGLFYSVNTKEKLWNQQNAQVNGTNTLSPIWHIYGCEADPDIFNFSMPGYSGTFFIENNGTTRNIGNKPYEVDLYYNFPLQPYSNWTINDSEIVIKTDDGFTYYFGGSKEYLEISYPVDEQDGLGSIGYPVIVGWHLNKIVAPNGRVATFEYVNNLYQPSDPQEQDFILSVYQEFSGHQTDVQGPDQTNGIYFNSASYGSSWSTQRQVTKPAYLKKISVGNTTIEFSYSEKANKFYKDEYHAFNRKNYQLDAISVKSEGIVVKEFNFGYDYLGGTTNARFFLTSFREVGMNPYKFEYYLPYQSLPDPKTRGIDHWGFWNSYDQNALLIPELYFYRNGDTEFTQNDVRAASSSLYNATLLRKITYPTLGFTEFIYEPHDYSERLERRSFNAFLPLLETVDGKAGGARIAFIKDHDGEEYTNEREFKYVHGFPTGGVQSSGILLNWPRYVFYYEMTTNGLVKHLEYKSTSYQVNHYPGEKYIQYADVTEISKPSNGCTQYKFSSYLSHYDFTDDDNDFPIIDYGNYVYNLDLFNNIKGLKYNDRSFERGKLTEVITYKSKAEGGFSPAGEPRAIDR